MHLITSLCACLRDSLFVDLQHALDDAAFARDDILGKMRYDLFVRNRPCVEGLAQVDGIELTSGGTQTASDTDVRLNLCSTTAQTTAGFGFAQPGTCSSYLELYRYLFEYARVNWKFLQNAFETVGKNSFGDFIASYSEGLVIEITRQNRSGEGLTPKEKLQMDVYTYGISMMYRKWIFDQYELSSEQAAQALYDIMPETLRDLWLKEERSAI